MGAITIDSDFQSLLIPLTSDEYQLLEQSIINEGCRDAIVLWDGIIIDGHNRYAICTKHGINYKTIEMKFANRQSAKTWIILNQLGRRNISAFLRVKYAVDYLKPLIAEKAKAKQKTDGKDLGGTLCQKSDKGVIHTTKELALAAGVSHDTVHRVEKILEKAPKEVITKLSTGDISINQAYQQVRQVEKVKELKRPHVTNNSGNNEWYTPKEYIEIAYKVMGSIDCDPASSDVANKIVQAKTFYSEQENGLNQTWNGNVWMNPPYAQPLISLFADKLIQEWNSGNIKQACVLVNNATETNWFQTMAQRANAIWFIKGRIKYLDNTGTPANTPLQGQCILYFGDNINRFKQYCGGLVCEV